VLDQISRVVIKVGSSSITDASGTLSEPALSELVAQICDLAGGRVHPVLVTSGAVAAGRSALGITPGDDTDLRTLAAVGQGLLSARYAQLFGGHNRTVGQVLLTAYDFGKRQAYLNARNTLERLLERNVIPIVNENDTVTTDEISLGENDRLAALIATMLKADFLILLTDTAGVFSADPRLSESASLIEEVTEVDARLEAVAGASRSGVGTGGMASKVAAAKIASWSGVPCVIANASEPEVLKRLVSGESIGTRIHPHSRRLSARKVWIAFALRSMGHVVVDDGAARALDRGASLLPVGVKEVGGDFAGGDAIEVKAGDGGLVAKGLAASSASTLRQICGSHTPELPAGTPQVAIHRDDLVWLHMTDQEHP
jgi:glutamate 5-kinase